MSKRLIILGASGNAADILDIVDALNSLRATWDVVGLLDDAAQAGTVKHGRPIIGKVVDVARFLKDTWFINAIGSEHSFRARGRIIGASGVPNNRFATLVHPGAAISRGAELGVGSYACFGVSAGHGVRVGRHVHLGVGAILGHDSEVADYALVGPGAVISGFAKIGSDSYVGAGACVKQNIVVGAGALVGLGAVVVRDVAANTTVAGNPARPLGPSRA